MKPSVLKADVALQQLDELLQRADELPAVQQEVLDELMHLISGSLAATHMPSEILLVWKDVLARTCETLQGGPPDHSASEPLSSSLPEDFKEESEASKAIGVAQIPDDVLCALLANRHLKSATRLTIMVFDRPWKEEMPAYTTIVSEWRCSPGETAQVGTRFPLQEGDVPASLFVRDVPLVIEDTKQDVRFDPPLQSFVDPACTIGLILYPLVAGGKWYGMFAAHYEKPIPSDIASHLRGLLDQAALAIYTMLLFEAEARARQAAEQANNQKMKLLATISHEMRTPLTSIKGFATTLLADDVEWSPDSQRDFIETISQEADKLSELIEHLLSHSRLEAGTLPITPKTKHVQDILSIAMAQLQTLTASHELRIHLPPNLPSVFADPRRLAQVLTNLVKNAVEYSPQQSTIDINVSEQDKYIKIDVSDGGLGIPPQERAQVFEAFHRGARAKEIQRKGIGLGLAICRGIIEAHHGKIWIQDRTEPGTTISFTIPINGDLFNKVQDASNRQQRTQIADRYQA